MNPTPGLGQALDGTALIRRSSFGPGAWLLDGSARADLAVYYAYCRAIDDCADEYAPAEARGHLAAWSKELGAMARGRAASPLGRELTGLCRRRRIPLGLLTDLWRGASLDAAGGPRFARFSQVQAYAYQVAGSVGLACLPIFGLDLERGRGFAVALGEAFQLINIVRDAREDAARGRLYFAQADLRAHGVKEKDFLGGSGGAGAAALLADYAGRARAALGRADAAGAGLDPRGL
ncbi:MAG TPA: squalene/phytoene synthase family protein, partial [bacterium]|nr:squalene/phytoene synthase family protein [bacterium]